MTAASSIGHRHQLDAGGLKSAGGSAMAVTIILNDEWATSVSGQLIATTLVNLLCRQVGVVSDVEVVSVDAELRVWSPVQANTLHEAVVTTATWSVNDAVPVRAGICPQSRERSLTLYIGSAPAHASRDDLVLIGDAWRAWIGTAASAPLATPASECPVGPLFAASLGAGEVFKRSRGLLRGRLLDADGYSLWTGSHAVDWHSLAGGPEVAGQDLPPLHVVGAGAVGNAVALCLASARLRSGYVVFIDDDAYDDTNLNRCLLAGWCDQTATTNKAVSLQKRVATAGLDGYAHPGTLSGYLTSARPRLRMDVAAGVDRGEFGWVVSCVDKGTSRQDVQGLWPHHLVGASTLDLQARFSVYRHHAAAACLSCFNPAERDGDRLRVLEAKLRDMTKDALLAYCTENSIDAESVRDYLRGTRCGSVGEASVRALVSAPPREFSVGFVSLAAGVLATAGIWRVSLGDTKFEDMPGLTIANFLNGGLEATELARDTKCEKRCAELKVA